MTRVNTWTNKYFEIFDREKIQSWWISLLASVWNRMVTDLPLIAPTNGKSVFKQAYTLSGLQINCNTCKKCVSGVFQHVPGVFYLDDRMTDWGSVWMTGWPTEVLFWMTGWRTELTEKDDRMTGALSANPVIQACSYNMKLKLRCYSNPS